MAHRLVTVFAIVMLALSLLRAEDLVLKTGVTGVLKGTKLLKVM